MLGGWWRCLAGKLVREREAPAHLHVAEHVERGRDGKRGQARLVGGDGEDEAAGRGARLEHRQPGRVGDAQRRAQRRRRLRARGADGKAHGSGRVDSQVHACIWAPSTREEHASSPLPVLACSACRCGRCRSPQPTSAGESGQVCECAHSLTRGSSSSHSLPLAAVSVTFTTLSTSEPTGHEYLHGRTGKRSALNRSIDLSSQGGGREAAGREKNGLRGAHLKT